MWLRSSNMLRSYQLSTYTHHFFFYNTNFSFIYSRLSKKFELKVAKLFENSVSVINLKYYFFIPVTDTKNYSFKKYRIIERKKKRKKGKKHGEKERRRGLGWLTAFTSVSIITPLQKNLFLFYSLSLL